MTTMTREPVSLAEPQLRRFTVEEYHRMAESGVFGPEERTELIEGVIYTVTPPGPLHSSHVSRLIQLLVQRFADRCLVRVQDPVQLGAHSQPQPDMALARAQPDHYASRHPRGTDLLLAIEVAVSSLGFDRGRKARLYAMHGIPELWVIDAEDRRIIIHRQPSAEGYAEVFELGPGDTLAPLAFPDDPLDVEELLGPSRATE